MCKHKPTYEKLLANYVNGNRKDFAFQVKEFGLGNFIGEVTERAARDRQNGIFSTFSPQKALEMIGVAVRLGGYE